VGNLWDYRPRVWDYREATWTLDRDLDGYDVDARDGCVGTIDHAITEVSAAYVVVDLSLAAPGRKRLIPAGAISMLDHPARKVHVALTQDEIRDAPDYEPGRCSDVERGAHGRYYRSYVSA
jgi:hypothetical protein